MFPDNDFQADIPQIVTSTFIASVDVYKFCHYLTKILCVQSDWRKSRVLGITIQTWPYAQGHDVYLHGGRASYIMYTI